MSQYKQLKAIKHNTIKRLKRLRSHPLKDTKILELIVQNLAFLKSLKRYESSKKVIRD